MLIIMMTRMDSKKNNNKIYIIKYRVHHLLFSKSVFNDFTRSAAVAIKKTQFNKNATAFPHKKTNNKQIRRKINTVKTHTTFKQPIATAAACNL